MSSVAHHRAESDGGADADRAGTGWLAGRWLRRRWVAMLPLALLMAIGTAGTTVALAAAQRTSSAYGDYLARAEVGDLVINPSVRTREIDAVIRSLPGVERVTSDAQFTVTFDDGQPRSFAEVDEAVGTSTFLRGSQDGRYLDMDRPTVRSGRLPTGTDEAVLTVEATEAMGVGIGDVIPLAFWPPASDAWTAEAYRARAGEQVAPIGVEQVEVVGIVTLADEVLPDELYPRQKAIVSPDIAARYDCLPLAPAPGSTLAEAEAALYPSDCAVSYGYYSLSLAGGAAGVKAAQDEFVRRAAVLNEGLADISGLAPGEEPPEYFMIAIETDQEQRRVERATRPTVTALLVLGAAAAVATLALGSLLVARELRRTQADQRQWHQLGVGPSVRMLVVAAPLGVAVLAGVAAGILGGWLVDTGPIGLVRAVEPRPARRFSSEAVLAAAGIGLVATLVVAVLAVRSARQAPRGGSEIVRDRVTRRLGTSVGSVAVADGLRAAFRPRAAAPVVAAGALVTGAFVAALVFGTSLVRLVSTPHSYGWPWDVAAMTGGGYGDLDLDAAAEALRDDPDVASWTALGFVNVVALDGEPLLSVLGLERTSSVGFPVLAGALPAAADEIAVGATTASARGLRVGDTVELSGAIAPRPATVTGIIVFPTLGPILADRVSTGTGMLLPEALFESDDLEYLNAAQSLATFVGIELREGADTPATRSRMRELLPSLDKLGIPPEVYPTPVRPPEIVDASSTRGVPTTVASVFAGVAAIGLAFASWASARSRRRELGVLRALGFTGSQIRRSVHVQSLATMVGALVMGVPVGVLGGRVLWRSFAEQLGVVPDPASPWGTVILAVVGGLVLAALASLVPARLASRLTPADGLRSE